MGIIDRLSFLIAPPLCVACGAHSAREPLCRRCRAELRWLGRQPVRVAGVAVWAPLAYAGGARALVHALKFRGAPRLADVMAAQISANAPPGLLWGATLVPVPLHHARLRRRGFNQAALLAAALASRCDGRVSECLRRPASDAPQVGRGRAERLTALEQAVEMRAHKPLPNRAVLIDDVVTTGATIAACACALRRGGAPSVVAIAYARTPGR